MGMILTMRRGLLLKTGQTIQYGGELDDGYYRKGLDPSLTVLTTGQYAGTFNIDLAHYVSGAGAVTFNNTLKTIVDTGAGLAIFKTNDVITTDDADNPGPFTVTTGNVAGTITCTGATFVDKTPAGTITIKKREAHANSCVYDRRTKLYWSRTVAALMGPASDGRMPWTGQLYDIFAYAAAANAGAGLAGYADWRVCNTREWNSIKTWSLAGGGYAGPDPIAFPGFVADFVWTSTTDPSGAAVRMMLHNTINYGETPAAVAALDYVMLVRGG